MRDSPIPLLLAISIDVEEEGLFCGRYPRTPGGVENVAELRRLEFITSEFGIPLTLLVAHSVAVSLPCRVILDRFREKLGAEIGAHLHPWNTPPFQELAHAEPVRSSLLPPRLLEAKFETLLTSLKDIGVFPQSFRMGRFDLGRGVCRLLPGCGIKVDSSIVPLRNARGGPDHFLAPADPFPLKWTTLFGKTGEEGKEQNRQVWEAPLTNIAIFPASARLVYRLAGRLPAKGRDAVLTGFRHIGAAGIHPAWYPLQSMKAAAALHRARGGQVLNMFLHSSELMPGATPSFRTTGAVDGLVEKIRKFLTWLVGTGPIRGVRLCELPKAGLSHGGAGSQPPKSFSGFSAIGSV